MRLELTRVGLLVELANHYTTRGAFTGCRYGTIEEKKEAVTKVIDTLT